MKIQETESKSLKTHDQRQDQSWSLSILFYRKNGLNHDDLLHQGFTAIYSADCIKSVYLLTKLNRANSTSAHPVHRGYELRKGDLYNRDAISAGRLSLKDV